MMIKKPVALLLGFNMLIFPAVSLAGPTIPGFHGTVTLPPAANALPVPRGNSWNGVQNIVTDNSRSRMVINQNQPRATIDWNSFNIGANAEVYFSQKDQSGAPQKDWAALNRIYDRDPSQIFGRLTADGKVYLINQNGILFGASSQINVHSLIASTLNMKNTDFINGLLRFRSENYQDPNYDSSSDTAAATKNLTLPPPDANAAVSNLGNINTDTGGSVFLLGPYVENGGTITTPVGKINLVAVQGAGSGASPANSEVSIVETSDPGTNDVAFSDKAIPGTTINLVNGRLIADSGRIGLYGATVQQNGLIRAVTAVKRGGEIYLAASDRVVTGAQSQTESPVSDSTEKADQSFTFSGGTISVGGLSTKTDEVSLPVKQPLQRIEHYGALLAPSGTVALNAIERVLLGTGSSINVAGFWADEPASAAMIEVQLNSVQLADFYGQKNGPLKGQNISINALNGSSIGNVSGYYVSQERTARERSTKGGTVTIEGFTGADTDIQLGELIVKDGAVINFSGGGFRYSDGIVSTTKLLSGNSVFDISNAPQSLSYKKILGDQRVIHKRYGITESFKGLYLGGGTPLNDYAQAWIAGSDAGTLSVAARQVVLAGALNGSVTRGQYQTQVTSHSETNHQAYDISVARGLEEPSGGTLIIGRDPGGTGNVGTTQVQFDSVVEEIAVLPTTTPPNVSDAPTGTRTELSAAILNSAGLGSIGLFANTSLSIDAGARLALLPGGSFTARARRIENLGEVHAAGGSAEFMIRDNITSHPFLYNAETQLLDVANPRYVPLVSTLYFAPGSVVSLAGEKIDNSSAGRGTSGKMRNGHTSGGQLTIQDFTVDGTITGNNLVVAQGALLDVSGGYQIDQKGKIKGGDAGTLTLRAMNLSLAGDLRGLALPGKKGGQINLHAGEVVVGTTGSNLPENLPPDTLPSDSLKGKLLLAHNRFQDTGFTRVGLTAINNVTFESGTDLEPSTARLPSPVPGGAALSNTYVPAGSISNSDYLGPTSVSAEAGKNIYPGDSGTLLDPNAFIQPNQSARVTIASGVAVKTAPGGAISMTGPSVDVAGGLQALAGNISLKATSADLTISGTVDASGYLKPVVDTVAGQPAGLAPQVAGTVSLEATSGGIILNAGAKVDVSGTAPTVRLISGTDGLPVRVTVAGGPGSLKLTYGTGLALDGEIDAHARYTGVGGGTLAIKKNLATGVGMTVSDGDMRRYQASGFDALTFQSDSSIAFNGPVDFTAGRSLTLDAPLIRETGHDDVTLNAPWVRLVNTSSYLPTTVAAGVGSTSRLSLAGDWIDLEGSTSVTGFGNVLLNVLRDMRFADQVYPDPSNNGSPAWFGGIATAGNLTMQASRIYPTTASDFTITTHGKVTVLPSGYSDTTPIYSAGGKLTINADQGIEHRGVLAAPMGNITLNATGSGRYGRVYLADGSVIKTSGDASVNYGSFDGTYWTVKDIISTKGLAVNGSPDKSITVNGGQVFVMEGAQLDFAGGGSIYTYFYEAGIEGTTNPISIAGTSALTGEKTRGNRYVIMLDNSVQLPGYTDKVSGKLLGAVHLEATTLRDGTSLKEGTYSLLPEQFAFLPGAVVLTDLNATVAAGAGQITKEGYRVVGGYETFLGTDVRSSVLKAYSIRTAADVLTEGNFTVKTLTAGDAGSMTVKGNTTVMAGTVKAGALPGYKAGVLDLSGGVITVQNTITALDKSSGFDMQVPSGMDGQLRIASSTLSDYGLGTLTLGDENTTSLTVETGSVLNVPNITLKAKDTLTIQSGAQVNAISENGDGKVTLSAPKGLVDIQSATKDGITTNAVVHASDAITLDVNDINLAGDLKVDSGVMNLTSSNIYFVSGDFTRNGSGLYMAGTLRDKFAAYNNLTLTSRGDMTFMNSTDLTVAGTLTLDAASYTGTDVAASFNAKTINIRNTSGKTSTVGSSTTGSLVFNADRIAVSLNSGGPDPASTEGDIVFNGFKTVTLNSLKTTDSKSITNDITLKGAGSLKTNSDLNFKAARVTTSYYKDDKTAYRAADFLIDAGYGAVNISNSGGTAGASITPGGALEIRGGSINHESGLIEVAAGQVRMTATKGDVTLGDGAKILAKGTRQGTADPETTQYLPGGRITLQSEKGKVDLKDGSELNVSASDYGDAGAITLTASSGGVTTDGSLLGKATGGKGGSLSLDTTSLLDTVDGVEVNRLSALNSKLNKGGFTESLNIRARKGNLKVESGQTIAAHEVLLAADGNDSTVQNVTGKINVEGIITASDGTNGGTVELYAQNDLTVTGSIDAGGEKGGEVFLGSQAGAVALQDGLINVSGGGTVYLRAQRNGTDNVKMSLAGEIRGASSVVAEAFKVYQKSGVILSADINSWLADTSTYMTNATTNSLTASLLKYLNTDPSLFHFRPGIEVQSGGDLTLASSVKVGTTAASTWDLRSTRYSGEPGALTLRAAGNLSINAKLLDHPTASYKTLTSNSMLPSWGINMVAGADLAAADTLAVNAFKTGDLTIGSGNLVYTENAPIRFASANDTKINAGVAAGYMITDSKNYSVSKTGNAVSFNFLPISYTLASYGGSIRGYVGNDLTFTSGATTAAIQTATGDIDLEIGNDLKLGSSSGFGAIRTTGEYAKGAVIETGPGSGITRSAEIYDYWTYQHGGDIRLDVGGAVSGDVLTTAWDYAYGGGNSITKKNLNLSASFQGVDSTKGIATMGGGDISVRTGGAFNTQVGAFGTDNHNYSGSGDLSIVTGGDLKGRFRVMDGTASLTSAGNFGGSNAKQILEIADTRLTLSAQGDVHVGAVLNPDNSRDGLFFGVNQGTWNLTYGKDTSVSIASLSGDVTLYGGNTFASYNGTALEPRLRILPADFALAAAGDARLLNDFYQAPAPTGNLRLVAGGSLDGESPSGYSKIFMTDHDPQAFYGYLTTLPNLITDDISTKVLVHKGDNNPIEIRAGEDIRNLQLYLTKKAEITAGRDILGLVYSGQNIEPTDVTKIRAGRDIHYDYILAGSQTGNVNINDLGIQQGGPGFLVIQAGDNIELGNSQGIKTIGNFQSPLLSNKGADLIVVAGAKKDLQPADAVMFFDGKDGSADHQDDSLNGLRKAGSDYSDLKAQGKTKEALRIIEEARSAIIRPLFDETAGDDSGTITMTKSQISTLSGKDAIYVLARGTVNVGQTAFTSESARQATGIFTASGGPINIYAGGDVNVNESRVMTFLGGNITVWSDQGNVNAGRGAKTTVSASPPQRILVAIGPPAQYVTRFSPPAVGSGIRALTYDPDGLEGSLQPPLAGDIYLFAPKGAIDAGEAGIAGGRLVLGATQVLNAQNISFSAGSVGVPTSSDSGVNLGALSGTSALADSNKMIEQTTLGASRDMSQNSAGKLDQFLSSWLDVKVISFDAGNGE